MDVRFRLDIVEIGDVIKSRSLTDDDVDRFPLTEDTIRSPVIPLMSLLVIFIFV